MNLNLLMDLLLMNSCRSQGSLFIMVLSFSFLSFMESGPLGSICRLLLLTCIRLVSCLVRGLLCILFLWCLVTLNQFRYSIFGCWKSTSFTSFISLESHLLWDGQHVTIFSLKAAPWEQTPSNTNSPYNSQEYPTLYWQTPNRQV